MKRNIQYLLSLSILIGLMFAFTATNAQTEAKKEVPEEFKNKPNPYKGDESLNMVGMRNFNRHCVSCHGKKGVGDGVMAKNLKTHPGDLTKSEFQKHTDGEIYYLSFVGVNERPDFMKLIPSEEDKWAIVNYIRTLEVK